MMHSFLEAAAADQRGGSNVVRTWVRQVRDLAYDVEDCIEFVVVHQESKVGRWIHVLPRCVAALAAPPRLLDLAAAEIEQLRARAEDVSRRNSRYSLMGDSGSMPVVTLQQPGTSSAGSATALDMLGEAQDSVQREPGFGYLAQLISRGDDDHGVISVWGKSDDVGTMSIIRKAYEEPEICKKFGCRGWVKLSHPFNPREFLQSVVAQFYTNACLQEGRSVDVLGLERLERMAMKQGGLIEEFRAQVSQTRYLLVLENLCTMGEWDAIRACLPKRENGNWIIVSTENREIARLCIGNAYQVVELKQHSSNSPVRVFFKLGYEGKETDMVMPSISEVNELNQRGHDRNTTSKKDAAHSWMEHFTLVGRESQIRDLRNYVTKARFENFNVMSVWGIAGVGKSTLVRNLYYDRMLEGSPLFDKFGWVNVLHPLDLVDFSRNLLLDLQSESLEVPRIEDPIRQCQKLLKEHRCFVVVNGLQSMDEWDLIHPNLVFRQSQSVIIAITTQESIAKYCADNDEIIFNVKGLEAEASFDLFKQKVNRKNPSSPLKDSKAKDLQQLILKCGGLPKVLVAIADFLAPKTVKSMESTRTMNQKFMHELESNQEFVSLRGLFGWMHFFFRSCPDFLRPCIFYMSIFPGYQIIRRRRLVMRWVAEGYCRDTKDNTAEEIGEALFSMLVNLSMMQSPPCTIMTNMRMVQCQVSAFFHEYIISRPEEENIISTLEAFALKGRCRPSTRRTGRHLVVERSWDRDRIVFDSIDFSRLRSLTVFGKWESFFISKSMKVLWVLDLEDAIGVTDKDLEQMVKMLPHLKFLSLRGNQGICHFPSSLGNLRQLETLDVRGTSIVTLPVSITRLKKLQYIRAGITSPPEGPSTPRASSFFLHNFCRPRQLVGVDMPRGIDKLTALHTLGVINVANAGGKATLKELKRLTQLCKLGVSGVNQKNCKEVCAAISCHVHLESLSLWLSEHNENCLDYISSPPEDLQSLKLYGLVKVVPTWIKDLPKLTKLDLEITISEEFDLIRVLGVMKELSILRICVNPLHDSDGKLDFCVWVNGIQQSCYLKVKVLEVVCSSKLNVAFGSEAMQNLEVLTARCSSESALQFFELKVLSRLKLKEVRLIGSHDHTLKMDMERQLNEHPRKPALKLEEPCSP